jgi:peptidylprolyl isomerase
MTQDGASPDSESVGANFEPAASGGQRLTPGASRFAIAALTCGILWLFWIGSVFALLFGYVALSRIKRQGGRGRGLALAGVALGWLGVAILSLVIVFNVGRHDSDLSALPAGTLPLQVVIAPEPVAPAPLPTIAQGCTTTQSAVASQPRRPVILPVGADARLATEPVITIAAGPVPQRTETKDLVVGTGATVGPQDTVIVNYLVFNYVNCAEFDSSWARASAQTFSLQMVVPGLAKGLGGDGRLGIAPVRVGGRREIIVPPSDGYGATGSGQILPNEVLVFVVDVLSASRVAG